MYGTNYTNLLLLLQIIQNHSQTRMRSSRMRTVRCSGRLGSGGGGVWPEEGVCLAGSAWGEGCLLGVCVCLPVGEGGCTPHPPVDRILDTCL